MTKQEFINKMEEFKKRNDIEELFFMYDTGFDLSFDMRDNEDIEEYNELNDDSMDFEEWFLNAYSDRVYQVRFSDGIQYLYTYDRGNDDLCYDFLKDNNIEIVKGGIYIN